MQMRRERLSNAVRSVCQLIVLILTLPITTQAATPFTTNTNFNVGSDGGANISIPIQVPPGTAGMSPTLSLNYNSNGGNGILGLGWGIDGLSQISRCPRTIIQDGAVGGVNYDTNDKLCIDGQRLISTGGTYGGNATEYRTELANFAKIVSYTTTLANGPDSFKVWTKAGQIIEYGNTADSRIEAAAKTVIKTWGVNKISDTKGNYITVTYTEDNPNGEAYVSRVDYTGNAATGLSPYANVQFTYETRSDTSTSYHAGSVIKQTKRITNIKTYAGNVLVKDYQLTYVNTGAYSVDDNNVKNGSLITQIKECDGVVPTATCLNPVTFNWQTGTVSLDSFSAAQTWAGLPAGASVIARGDINGDGRADVLYNVYTTGTAGYTSYAYSTGAGFSDSGVSLGGLSRSPTNCSYTCTSYSPWAGPYISAQLNDVNGDGLADVVVDSTIRLSIGTGFSAAQTWAGLPAGASVIARGDINGDGRADVLYNVYTTGTAGYTSYAYSTGAGFSDSGVSLGGLSRSPTNCSYTCTSYSPWAGPYISAQLNDVNGDGLADVVVDSTIRLSIGTGFSAAQTWAGLPAGASVIAFGDVNGDGRADVLYNVYTTGTAGYTSYAYSTGAGFSDSGVSLGGLSRSPTNCSYTCTSYSPWAGPYISAQLSDVNGDGLADVVASSTIRLVITSPPDLLLSYTEGLDSIVNITQNTLSTAGVYVADTGSVYPLRDILPTAPQYVVTTATTSDGNGGVLTNNYQYGGLKAHLTGRGSLGFRYQKVTQVDADTSTTTFFRQDYPYIGLPSQTENRITSTNTLVGASQLSYANSPITTGSAVSQFPYLSQSVEQNFELSGSLVNTSTTTNQYDGYGNAIQITVNSNDGYVKTTTNIYSNDTTNWFLGRLLRSTVTSTTP